MERLFLPPKIGYTLGALTLALGSYSLIQTVDAYGQSRYYEGQADLLYQSGQSQQAMQAEENIDTLNRNVLGNGIITVGFMSLSSLAFYWRMNGRSRDYT